MPKNAINHTMFALIARELMIGASCDALAQETGLHVATVRLLIKAMRQKEVLRVVRWDPDTRGARRRAVYRFKLSPLERDAERPISAETEERYYRRMRQVRASAV